MPHGRGAVASSRRHTPIVRGNRRGATDVTDVPLRARPSTAQVEAEFNAMCEGRHPAFALDEKILLDGSDGGRDYRMDLSEGQPGCGTWVRDGTSLCLLLGTIDQPPIDGATSDALRASHGTVGTYGYIRLHTVTYGHILRLHTVTAQGLARHGGHTPNPTSPGTRSAAPEL